MQPFRCRLPSPRFRGTNNCAHSVQSFLSCQILHIAIWRIWGGFCRSSRLLRSLFCGGGEGGTPFIVEKWRERWASIRNSSWLVGESLYFLWKHAVAKCEDRTQNDVLWGWGQKSRTWYQFLKYSMTNKLATGRKLAFECLLKPTPRTLQRRR